MKAGPCRAVGYHRLGGREEQRSPWQEGLGEPGYRRDCWPASGAALGG